MYRLPGGNFISAYDWRNAIGDPDKRPPIWDPVWNFAQPNDVGIDELMTFCRLLKVDPYVTLDAGFGEPRSGADLVEYANGAVTTPMGALRVKNGHPEPYHVKYWNVGNEMYGYWQFGHMALRYYTVKHNLFATAMRKVDPSITILASGAMPDEMTITGNAFLATGKVQAEYGTAADWTGGLLAHCLPNLDGVTEHWYANDGQRFDPSIVAKKDVFNPDYTNQDVFVNVDEPLVDALRRPSNRVKLEAEAWDVYKKTYPEIVTRKIFVSNDEWANMGSDMTMGTNLRIALSYGLVLQEMFRHTDFIKMSAYTMGTGTLDSSETDAIYNTTGLTFKLYGDHFGTIPVAVTGNSPQPAPKFPPGGDQPHVNAGSPTFPLDVSAAFTADRKFLTVAVVNPTESAQPLDLNFDGIRLGGNATLWQVTGPSLKSVNVIGKPPEVNLTSTPVSGVPTSLTIAPISLNIYQIPVQ
jgi:alpha-N-arabinofuranosidase